MRLPVLDGSAVGGGVDEGTVALRDALSAVVRGEVRFGFHDRMLYATDASLYQQRPVGVVVARDEEDVRRAVEVCDAFGAAVLPRGGGTSLAGQCTNSAVVIDTSAHMRGVGEIDVQGKTLYAQSGAALDEINNELSRRGVKLFYAPDPATTAQATVGGTIGNNASGSRSIKYGRTVDSVVSIDAVTSAGERVRLQRGAGRAEGRMGALALKLADGVMGVVKRYERLIRERYPKTLRRNAGYALDMILQQMEKGVGAGELDLVPLVCGSEGTLAVVTGARLRLFDVPRVKGLGLVSFAGVDEAIEKVRGILTTGPSAVELVDDVVIEAALKNIECAGYVRAFADVEGKSPTAVLYVEYHCGGEDELKESFEKLRAVVGGAPLRVVKDAAGMADAWKLRKAGEPLLHGLPGARKPLTFVEDNAVPVENLGRFVREFRKIVEREGTRAAFWAHASVGVLHVRPMLDPRDDGDRAALLRIAVEVADLARECGGVMSGEHGDGKVRGPLLERFYGAELMKAFAEVKGLFDPKGLLNPGNIVSPGAVETILQGTRLEPEGVKKGVEVGEVKTFYEYSADEGFEHAVERCNGAGVCRKQSGGTMCPSYRGTLDERHSTRGRGNALRLAITGQLSAGGVNSVERWRDAETMKTLDLCLSCKACKSECPSNVDIAKLKAEYTAQGYMAAGKVPMNKALIGYVRVLNRVGAVMPGVANWVNGTRLMRAVINRVMGMHPRRSMPRFSASLYRVWGKEEGRKVGAGRVVLFGDCFSAYNESRIGLAAKKVLKGLGWSLELPRTGCCGRSMISVGMLEQAIATADATIEQLRGVIEDDGVKAIVFLEPSCLSAVKDDWLTLKCRSSLALRQKLASKAMLVEEFVERFWNEHPSSETAAGMVARGKMGKGSVVLHAHCHQKALWGAESSAAILRRVVGARLKVLSSGCCGMAGSFGYDRDKFELSMRIAGLKGDGVEPGGGVMPLIAREVAASGEGAVTVLATGTSCRHQIHDAAEMGVGGVNAADVAGAVHPVEFLAGLVVD
jgi:FAD/FMN-containing dehydrogenase/Fe-S oxidoreductase